MPFHSRKRNILGDKDKAGSRLSLTYTHLHIKEFKYRILWLNIGKLKVWVCDCTHLYPFSSGFTISLLRLSILQTRQLVIVSIKILLSTPFSQVPSVSLPYVWRQYLSLPLDDGKILLMIHSSRSSLTTVGALSQGSNLPTQAIAGHFNNTVITLKPSCTAWDTVFC